MISGDPEEGIGVMVLENTRREYFVPHVDLTKVAEYTAEAARAGGPDDASLGMLWHRLSALPVVTIAKLRGRARGAGSELALACDMRFAARENAVFGQPEVGFGVLPGAGGLQRLARLLGRGRALEATWGLPTSTPSRRSGMAGSTGRCLTPSSTSSSQGSRDVSRPSCRGSAIDQAASRRAHLPDADAIRADARRFQHFVASDAVKARMATLFAQGLQTRGDLELDLGNRIGSL